MLPSGVRDLKWLDVRQNALSGNCVAVEFVVAVDADSFPLEGESSDGVLVGEMIPLTASNNRLRRNRRSVNSLDRVIVKMIGGVPCIASCSALQASNFHLCYSNGIGRREEDHFRPWCGPLGIDPFLWKKENAKRAE